MHANVGDILLAYEGLLDWQKATSPFVSKDKTKGRRDAAAAEQVPPAPAARTASHRKAVGTALGSALKSRVKS